MGWSLVSFIRFKGFIPDYLSCGWADTKLHPFLYFEIKSLVIDGELIPKSLQIWQK